MHIQVWRGLNKGDDRGDAMKDAYKDDEDAFEETYGYNPWITYEWGTVPEQKKPLMILMWIPWPLGSTSKIIMIIQDADEAVFDSRVALLIEKLAAVPESKIVGSPYQLHFLINSEPSIAWCRGNLGTRSFFRPGRGRPLWPDWKTDQKDGPEGDQFHHVSPADTQWQNTKEEHPSARRGCWQL